MLRDCSGQTTRLSPCRISLLCEVRPGPVGTAAAVLRACACVEARPREGVGVLGTCACTCVEGVALPPARAGLVSAVQTWGCRPRGFGPLMPSRRPFSAPCLCLLGCACLRLPQDPQLPEPADAPGPAGRSHDAASEPDAARSVRGRTVPGAAAGPWLAAPRGHQEPLWQVCGRDSCRRGLSGEGGEARPSRPVCGERPALHLFPCDPF